MQLAATWSSSGLRRHGDGRHGIWFPLAALGAVAALTGLSIAILKIATPSWDYHASARAIQAIADWLPE